MVRSLRQHLRQVIRDETGSANTEYVIVGGLILIAAVVILGQVGPKLLARWEAVDQKLGGGETVVVNHTTTKQ